MYVDFSSRRQKYNVYVGLGNAMPVAYHFSRFSFAFGGGMGISNKKDEDCCNEEKESGRVLVRLLMDGGGDEKRIDWLTTILGPPSSPEHVKAATLCCLEPRERVTDNT